MKIAQALAAVPWMDEQALERPAEMKFLAALNTIAQGYGLGRLGGGMAGALSGKTIPAQSGILPELSAGSKEGPPHALWAYKDMFGPGQTERDIFNVFGNPAHPSIQKIGWGSSVSKDVLEKAGIPVIGRQAKRAFQ